MHPKSSHIEPSQPLETQIKPQHIMSLMTNLPPSHFVGRVAQVIDTESSLSNEYVTIEDCVETERVYMVRRVYRPPDTDNSPIVRVGEKQLKLITGDEFTHRFPDACLVKGSTMTDEIQHGSIVDFSEVQMTSLDWGFSPMLIKGSCRLVGEPQADCTTGTCIRKKLVVDTTNDDDIVELEHLSFRHDDKTLDNNYLIICKRGRIQFRNCGFMNSTNAILVDGNAQVLMESCTVKNMSGTAVTVRTGEILMINGVFSALNIALVTFQRCTLRHCSFQDCVKGIIAPAAANLCLTKCNLQNCSDFAVAVKNGITFSMTSCFVVGCNGTSIVIEGGNRTSAIIAACKFSECAVAVRMGSGLIDVQLVAIMVEKCSIGLFTMIDAIGSVVIVDYTALNNKRNRLDMSGSKCYTNIDGVLQPHDLHVQRANVLALKSFESTNLHSALNIPWSKFGKRQLKATGVGNISCKKCGVKEVENAKFKACGQCKNASYCSKECQTEHWHAYHRDHCKYIAFRAKCMEKKGFIACAYCHKAERMHRSDNALFSSCVRCLQVFYCSDECLEKHWKAHKASCKK